MPLLSLAAAPVASGDHRFSFRVLAMPATLDWNKAYYIEEVMVLTNLMEGLFAYDSQMKVVPALARNMVISDDGLVYTFQIREDVKWSDGKLLRAQDFVFSWKRLLSPLTAARAPQLLFDIEQAEAFNKGEVKDFAKVGVRALDDLTLQVRLVHPNANWLAKLASVQTFPLREDVVEQHGPQWTSPGKIVTLGPFTLNSQDYDVGFVLRANSRYYRSHGNLDDVQVLVLPDEKKAIELYERGKLDLLPDVEAITLGELKGRPDLRMLPAYDVAYLGFNVTKYPMNNVHVRRAVAMAIDKQSLVKRLQGGQLPAQTLVPPGMLGYSRQGGLPFDPMRARAELAQAGIERGKTLALEFIVYDSPANLSLLRLVGADLKRYLRIETSIKAVSHKDFSLNLDLKAYPIYKIRYAADYRDPDNFLSLHKGSVATNHTGWKSAKYDDWVTAALKVADPARQGKLYAEAQKVLLEQDAVIVPLFYLPYVSLVKPRVQGLVLNPLKMLYLRDVSVP